KRPFRELAGEDAAEAAPAYVRANADGTELDVTGQAEALARHRKQPTMIWIPNADVAAEQNRARPEGTGLGRLRKSQHFRRMLDREGHDRNRGGRIRMPAGRTLLGNHLNDRAGAQRVPARGRQLFART